ncbi:MAG: hypothetical protein LBQ15_01995 [Clostridium sp.]|jgi:hypothetical protein|nr:hypothetical protein [Clostridium sp.]
MTAGAAKRNRVDTGALFAGLVGQAERIPEPRQAAAAPAPEASRRAQAGEGRKQVSLYLPGRMDRELGIQAAAGEKEGDRSALARAGIGIALAISPENYARLRAEAEASGKDAGQIVQEALSVRFARAQGSAGRERAEGQPDGGCHDGGGTYGITDVMDAGRHGGAR